MNWTLQKSNKVYMEIAEPLYSQEAKTMQHIHWPFQGICDQNWNDQALLEKSSIVGPHPCKLTKVQTTETGAYKFS